MLLAGQAASLLGSNIVQYAIVWYMVMSTNSGLMMTAVMIIQCLPQGLVSLLGGVWADRWNRKTLIMLPDAVIAVITVFLALGFASGRISAPFILCALAFRWGCGRKVGRVGVWIGVRYVWRGAASQGGRSVFPGWRVVEEDDRGAGPSVRGGAGELGVPRSAVFREAACVVYA
ncbi:MFS transporter [Bifidobacterium pullorum]|uniref:MFS transporter n=1 Tax=Bifidobacterium pullorum TaxID=78448 RepID=UPI001EF61FB9|nr:MFS transporter [Bifidobacterium pullorum]